MPHYTTEQIDAANRMDIAAFLISRGEKLKRQGQEFIWRRNNVWIKDNEWYSHYDTIGGHAVSFVMRYFNLDFQSAMAELIGGAFTYVSQIQPKEQKAFELPPRNKTMNQVYAYLLNKRFLSREVISYFAHKGTLYEEANHHNAVFVGLDKNGTPLHCHLRGTKSGDCFKQTVSGSQAAYSFHHIGTDDTIYIFEAPIDMLSYITLNPDNWQKHSYVALCSVAEHAMFHQLKTNPNLHHIFLCLDNDDEGSKATKRLKQTLNENGYTDIKILKPICKDWDEDLKQKNGAEAIKASAPVVSVDIIKLCHVYINQAKLIRRPSQLRNKVEEAYNGMINAYDKVKQTEKLLLLLLLLAKDESRKCRSPLSWEEIKQKLISACEGKTKNTLNNDMRNLLDFYNTTSMTINADMFVDKILAVCADIIFQIKNAN